MLYNLSDIYFAWLISEKAIAWLQLAFPIFFLILSFNEAFWTAINNLISIQLGKWKKDQIWKYFFVWLILSVLLWIIFSLFSEQIVSLFISFYKVWDVISYAKDYAVILLQYSVLYIFWWMIWQLLIVFKEKRMQIILALIILILNIIWNYFLAIKFWFWVKWIAYSTVISWFILDFIWLTYLIWYKKLVSIDFSVNISHFKIFLKFSFTALVVMLIAMLAVIIENYFFWQIGETALAAYSIWIKFKDIFFYPLISGSIAFSILYGFFLWKKDFKTLSKLIAWINKVWFYYWLGLVVVMPLTAILLWKLFTNNIQVLHYLKIFMFLAPFFMFWYIYRFIYSSALQVNWYHKSRVIVNLIFVILLFTFEYILYYFFRNFYSILIWNILQAS